METKHPNAAYQTAGERLREAVRAEGPDLLKHPDRVEELLRKDNGDSAVAFQMALFLQTGNLDRFLPQAGTGAEATGISPIGMIDANNILSRTEQESGLKKDVVKRLLVAVFYALSIPNSLETKAVPSGAAGIEDADKVLESSDGYEALLDRIRTAIRADDAEALSPLLPALNHMADNGYAEAQYLKGLCYYKPLGTEQNRKEAERYFEMAARNGNAAACARLGDCQFEKNIPNYTKAFAYYTALGSTALDATRQGRIKTIIAEKELNGKRMIANAVLLGLLLVFGVFFATGFFSPTGETHVVAAVLSMVFACAGFALSVFCFLRWRYNSLQWATPLFFLPAMLCVFLALL